MHKLIIQKSFGLIVLCLLSVQSYSETMVNVAWRVKAPYQYIENGVEKGYLLDRAKQIFSIALIPAKFQVEPAKRIWTNFTNGTKNYCSFDWYKNPEREALARFSRAFQITPAYSVMANPVFAAQISEHKNLTSLLADTKLTIGLVDSVSYGNELDNLIKNGKNTVERNSVLPMVMARMVAANRASYMFIDKREWQHLREHDNALRETEIVDVKGIPSGLNSYIVCSKDITNEQMQRINAAIEEVTKAKSH
jgi:polar amino acid transport system substrate-binding protein